MPLLIGGSALGTENTKPGLLTVRKVKRKMLFISFTLRPTPMDIGSVFQTRN